MSGVVLGGALLAGTIGIAGQAGAAPLPAPTSLQAGGPAPLSSMPAPATGALGSATSATRALALGI